MGTVHVLEAARRVDGLVAVIVVTSDKCYENVGAFIAVPRARSAGRARSVQQQQGGRRTGSVGVAPFLPVHDEPTGGRGDGPSRQCDRRGRLGRRPPRARLHAQLRGRRGGDDPATRTRDDPGSTCSSRWRATSPWPSGSRSNPRTSARAGTSARPPTMARPVSWVVDRLAAGWGEEARWERDTVSHHPHEAMLLHVDASKARAGSGWEPRLPLDEASGLDRRVVSQVRRRRRRRQPDARADRSLRGARRAGIRVSDVLGDEGRRVETCRSCDSRDLKVVLALGSTPVANALVDAADVGREEPTYPLEVVFCENCALVQLGYALPAERIFDGDYPYFSSVSDAYVRHATAHVDRLIAARGFGANAFVVEVASNDGYLLRSVVSAGVRALGIDPAPGPAAAAAKVGVPTIVGFFGLDMAAAIRAEHGPADAIIANNVMAHVPDLNDVVAGWAALLADDGVLTIENPYVRDTVDKVAFDTIYHEHYCYFSCSSVDALMSRHGLHLNDVEYFPDLHGGTLRWHVGKRSERSMRCRRMLDDEKAARHDRVRASTRDSRTGCWTCQHALRALLGDLRGAGRTVAAYGAAAKGATLLNTTGIGTDLVAYVVDRNVHKHGRLMPGCRLPIRPVEVLLEDRPDDTAAAGVELRRRDRRATARVRGDRRALLRADPDAPPHRVLAPRRVTSRPVEQARRGRTPPSVARQRRERRGSAAGSATPTSASGRPTRSTGPHRGRTAASGGSRRRRPRRRPGNRGRRTVGGTDGRATRRRGRCCFGPPERR